jgi:hypothetical protein
MIDGVVDNEVNTRAEEGDDGFVDVGHSVRQAGWDQVMVGSDTWPPDDQIVTLALTIDQWGLIVSSLNIWVAIVKDGDIHEGAAAARPICELVSAQVGEQLPEWPIPGQGQE